MVIYLPVKFEFNWTKHFQVRVQKRKCWWTDKRTKNRQTKKWNYTNFKRNLAIMVIYLPVKFEFNWTKHFQVRVQKRKCWWTDKRTKNRQTKKWNYTNFKRNLAMMVIYLPVKFEFTWTKHFQVRVRKRKRWLTNGTKNRQTDGNTPISKAT